MLGRRAQDQSDIGRIWLEVYKVQILILQGQHMASPLPWKLQENKSKSA